MRSKVAKRILQKTPKEIKDKANDYAAKLILYNFSGNICKQHNLMSKKMGYIEWYDWVDLKIKKGHIQRQCEKCDIWLFKCEQ